MLQNLKYSKITANNLLQWSTLDVKTLITIVKVELIVASEILLATFLDVDNLNFELKSYRVDNNLLVQSVSSQQCSSGIAHPRRKR